MTVESLIEAGRLELKQGSRSKAHGYFLEALELAPDNVNILLYLAASSTTKEQAEKYLNWAERLSPGHKGIEKGRMWAMKLPSHPERVDQPEILGEQTVEADLEVGEDEDKPYEQYRELSEDSNEIEKGKKSGKINFRLIIMGIVLFVLLVIAGLVLIPRLFSQRASKEVVEAVVPTDTLVVESTVTYTPAVEIKEITEEVVLQLPSTWTPQFTNTQTVRPSKTPGETSTLMVNEESTAANESAVVVSTEEPLITNTPTSTLPPNNQNYPLQNLSYVLENPENFIDKRLRVTGYLYYKSYVRIDNRDVYVLQMLPDLSVPSDNVEPGTTLVVLGFEPDPGLIEFSEITVYGIGLGIVEEKAPLREPVPYTAIWGVSYTSKEP